jgi:hypothetical protein
MASEDFPVQKVLELACAAQRTNKGYIKEPQSVYDSNGQFMFVKHSNKMLVRKALGLETSNSEPEFAPMQIFIEQQDKDLAEIIRKYYRRLVFAAVAGESDFYTEVNQLLNADTMKAGKLGFLACLPDAYARDYAKSSLERRSKDCLDEYLAPIDSWINDADCEILSCTRSKNFDAYNIDAIIDNKLVNWMGKQVAVGFAVVQKAKVKAHGHHWRNQKMQTRLHYIKVFQ